MRKRFLARLGILLGLVMGLGILSGPVDAESEWRYTIAPYLWFAGTNGDLTVGERDVDVEIGFSDILDSLDIGLLGQFEAQKNSWGLLTQVNYFKLTSEEDVVSTDEPTGFERELDVELETTMWIVELGGFYNLMTQSQPGFPNRVSLDVLAGGRYLSSENDLEATFTGFLTTLEIDRDSDIDWIDPFVGARARLQLTKRFLFSLRGDIGGFGIGEASDFTWNLVGLFGYVFTDWVSLVAGYKALSVDYDNSSEFDITMHGPLAGLVFTF